MPATEKSILKSPFLKTAFRGFLIIVPVLGIVYLFQDTFKKIGEIVEKVMVELGLSSPGEVWLIAIFTFIVLVLLSYGIGIISKTDPVVKFSHWLDEQLLNNSEIYRNLKLNVDNTLEFMLEDRSPVFIKFGEAERPGFLMEDVQSEGKMVVFIPKNFRKFDGNIYVVLSSNVRYAELDSQEFIYALEHLGRDMNIH